MTTQKDFKRVVRARMQKTGESYTTARSHLLRTPARTQAAGGAAPAHPTPPGPAPADYARLAGTADATIKAKTGCTWEKWVWALDKVNAHAWPHREIAAYVHQTYKVPGWWAQTVTVGYERIRGLREKGQRRSGSFEASRSATLPVAAGKAFRAFKEPRQRRRWLDGSPVVIRKATPNKSLRITWSDGTSVEVYLTAKGRSKCQVAVQHTKLPSRDAAGRMKAFWAERLGALGEALAPAART